MNQIYSEQYLKHYNNFIDQLIHIFPAEETVKQLNELKNLNNELKLSRGKLFASLLNDDKLEMFIDSKIKVFSHKSQDTQQISESLFGSDFCIKNLLNNQPDNIKKLIWSELYILCMFGELMNNDEPNSEKIIKLKNIITPISTPIDSENKSNINQTKIEEMLGVQVNDDTKTMIDDIVQSFEKVLTNQAGANPLGGIMEISQKISVKYADKINKGDIELDKIMKSITSKVPGMDQMMAGMSGMMGGEKKKPKEKIIIDENFSTANVNVGLNKEKESKSFDIGGILKMADSFGVIPGGKQQTEQTELPGLGKMMELMQKLDKTETNEDAANLKQEMDEFLQKEMGIDIDKLNSQIEQVMNTTELKKNQ